MELISLDRDKIIEALRQEGYTHVADKTDEELRDILRFLQQSGSPWF